MTRWLICELAPGEEPQAFVSTGSDERDAGLEQAVLDCIGGLLEIPPETLKLRFYGNYGTTAAALAEFSQYIEVVRDTWGQDFLQPQYVEWLRAAWVHSWTPRKEAKI